MSAWHHGSRICWRGEHVAQVEIDMVPIALLCSAAGADAIEERANVIIVALVGDSRNGNRNYGV